METIEQTALTTENQTAVTDFKQSDDNKNKNNFTENSIRAKLLNMLLPFIFVLILAVTGFGMLMISGVAEGYLLSVIMMIVAVLCVGGLITLLVLSGDKLKGVSDRYVMSLALALNSMLLPEIVLDTSTVKSSLLYIILGFMLTALLYFFGSAVFQNPKIWYILVSAFFSLYAFLQYYIYLFRGDPIRFADLACLSSVSAVDGQYSFTPAIMTVYCVLNLIGVIVFVIKIKITKSKAAARCCIGAGVAAGCVILYFAGLYAFNLGIINRYIVLGFSGDENYCTYSNVGFNLMFYFDGAYNHLECPDDYSEERAKDILSEYSASESENKPIIIAVLNESFADFEHIREFKTNKDYMPNYHKLQEESTSGYVTVSAYGGYTCNSEYEFLTGNSMAFFPSGTAIYTQYLDSREDSLVSYLNSQGYKTESITPCSEQMWKIGDAYKNLQFDESIFDCAGYKSKYELINGNIADSDVYSVVENEVYENKDEPFFAWVTTMQNHGPYDNPDSVPKQIRLKDCNNSEAEKYLNSIYQSDKALGELVDHFRNYDREVIIVMFGDHYPHIPSFTEELYSSGITGLSTENYSRLHQTPFLIWSNRSSEKKEISDISLNYLSNEVMNKAEIPLAPFQQELEKVRKSLPIISGFGYKTSAGDWYSTDESCDKTDKIKNEYAVMQYYRVFGRTK